MLSIVSLRNRARFLDGITTDTRGCFVDSPSDVRLHPWDDEPGDIRGNRGRRRLCRARAIRRSAYEALLCQMNLDILKPGPSEAHSNPEVMVIAGLTSSPWTKRSRSGTSGSATNVTHA